MPPRSPAPLVAMIMVSIVGLVNALSGLLPSVHNRLVLIKDILPLEIRFGSHLALVLSGFALLILAGSLGRRKRVAWMIVISLLFISTITHLLKGLDIEEATINLAAGLWLLSREEEFYARSDTPSMSQGLRVLATAILFTLLYGVSGFFVLDRHFSIHFGVLSAVRETIGMFSWLATPPVVPLTRYGRFFFNSIYTTGAVTIGYALVMLLRPVLTRQRNQLLIRERARFLIQQYGTTRLASFGLLPDKQYFFSTGGSLIVYRREQRVAVVLGDPIGPADDYAPAIQEFWQLCRQNDWQIVFYQTLPETQILYEHFGFSTLCIGHEAVVHLKTFDLAGSQKKSLRTAVNRLTRLGYTTTIHRPPLSDRFIHQLDYVSHAWLVAMHSREKHFSLGWFEPTYLSQTAVMTVRNQQGQIVGFVNFTLEKRSHGIAIDLMRRTAESEPGVMEFLFVRLIEWAKEQGYAAVNLGLSPLAKVGETPDDPGLEKLVRFAYDNLNQWYSFKGLYFFKEKFDPRWEPRYLVYPRGAVLPTIVLATIRVHR